MTIEDYKLIIESKNKIIEKYSIIDDIFKEFQIDGYDILIKIIKSYKSHKCPNIPVKDTKEDIDVENIPEFKKLKDFTNEKRKSIYYDANEEVVEDNREIVNLTSEISKLTKVISDIKINHREEIETLKSHYNEIIDNLKKKEEIPIPSPSISNESITDNKKLHDVRIYKNKFEDKSLPILERCNVIAYDYNTSEKQDKNILSIIDFISSEHKMLIKFNSNIVNKINNDEIWKDIYNFKVKNKELKDSSGTKTQFKNKLLRCKELYKIYGDNLSKFRIYTTYLGRLKENEWKQFLLDFDKLYKNRFKNCNLCTFILNKGNRNGQQCGRLKCNIHS